MKTYRIVRRIMNATRAGRVFLGFLIFFIICTTIFWLQEAHIETWGDAFWYSFSLVSTAGFGDVIVQTALSRILSVFLSLYAVIVIAILTAIVVSVYRNLIELRLKVFLTDAMDKIETLPDLSKEELKQLSEDFKKLKF